MSKIFKGALVILTIALSLFAGAAKAETAGDLLSILKEVPGLANLPVSDVKKTSKLISGTVTLRGKSLKIFGFRSTGTVLAAVVPSGFALTDMAPVPNGTPLDGMTFKDMAIVYLPKGHKKLTVYASTFPDSVKRAIAHSGARVTLKEGLNLYGEADFASSGGVKKVLSAVGIHNYTLPLSATLLPDMFKHDPKTASGTLKEQLLDALRLNLTLPKLRIPGIGNTVTVKNAGFTILSRKAGNKRNFIAGVNGKLQAKVAGKNIDFEFYVLADKAGANSKVTIKGDTKTPLKLSLLKTLELTGLSLVAVKDGNKWSTRLDAKSKLGNKPIDVSATMPAKGKPTVTIKTKLTMADILGNLSLPGIDDAVLYSVQMHPDNWFIHGKIKNQETYIQVQKPKSGSGHLVAAYLYDMSLAGLIPGAEKTPLKDVGFSNMVALYYPGKQATTLDKSGIKADTFSWIKKSNSNPVIKPGMNIFGQMKAHPSGEMAKLLKKVGVTELSLPLNGGFSAKAFSKNPGAVKNAILDGLDLKIKLPKLNIPEVSKFLTFKNGTLNIKGKTPDGKRGLDVAFSGDADVHIKSESIAFNIDLEYDKAGGSSELKFKGSSKKKWTHPLGIKFLDLDSLSLSIDKKNGKYDIKVAAKTDIGSHSRLDVKVDVHEKNGKVTDAFFELDGPLKLSEIPGVKDIPNSSHFTIDTIKVSEHGIEAKTSFGGKKDLDIFLFSGSGWNLIVRQDNFTITEFVPPLKNTPLKHIVLSEAAIVLSKDGLQGALSSFSPIAQDALKDIYGAGAANIDVDSGLSLIAAFEHKKSTGKMADALSRLGLSEERVIMTGGIGGLFGGPTILNVDVDLSAHTGAKHQPSWMASKPGVEAVFSLIATETAGQFDIEFGIGADITANVHGAELDFTAKTALEIEDEKIDVKIVLDLKDKKGWHKPFGIPGFTLYEVGMDLGIDEDGALHLGFDGNITVSGDNYKIAADADIEGVVPTDIAFIGSADKVDMFFVEEIAIAMMGADFKLDLPAGILPEFTKVKFAFVTPGAQDPDLHITGEGFALAGGMKWLGHELGSMDVAVGPKSGIKAAGKIDDLNLGPLHLKNNDFAMHIGLKSVPSQKINADLDFIGIKDRFHVAFGKKGVSFSATQKFGPDFSMHTDLKLSGIDISAKHPSFKDADFYMEGDLKLDIGKFIAGPAKNALDDVFNGLNAGFKDAEKAIKKAQKKVDGFTTRINAMRAKVRKEKAAAEAKVQSAENRVNGLKSRLAGEWRSYHDCHGWGKYACEIRRGIPIGLTKTEVAIADAALDFVKSLISHFPIDLDPRVAILIGERDTAKGVLYIAEKAVEGADDIDSFMKKAVDKLTNDLKNSINIHKAEFKGDLRGVIEHDDPVDLSINAEFFGATVKDTFAFSIGHIAEDLGKDVEKLGLMGIYALEHLVEKGISDIPGPLKSKLRDAITKKMEAKAAANKRDLAKYAKDFSKYHLAAMAIHDRNAAFNADFLESQLAKTSSPLDYDKSETFSNEMIEVGHTGLCLNNVNSGEIGQDVCSNFGWQKYSTQPVSGAPGVKAGAGYVNITSSGKCLAPEGAWANVEQKFSDPKLPKEGAFTFTVPKFTGNGKIFVKKCVNSKEYYWKVLKHGDGWMQMANLATNQCLHFTNSSAVPGQAMAEWKPCTGAANQVYRLADSATPKYYKANIVLKNDQTGLCFSNGYTANEVIMTYCDIKFTARYDYQVDIRGYVKFINRASGKCLQPAGYKLNDKLTERTCTQLDYQWWAVSSTPGGFRLKNAQTQQCTQPPPGVYGGSPQQLACAGRENTVITPLTDAGSGAKWGNAANIRSAGLYNASMPNAPKGGPKHICDFDFGGNNMLGEVKYNGCGIAFNGKLHISPSYHLLEKAVGVEWVSSAGHVDKQFVALSNRGIPEATIYACRQEFSGETWLGWTSDGVTCHLAGNSAVPIHYSSPGFEVMRRTNATYYELKLTN